jgi:hypothetical protein
VTGIERTDQGKESVQNGIATIQQWKIDFEFLACQPEIEPTILGQSRRQRIGVTMVETKSVAMQGISYFKSIIS